jgi:phosphoribosyl 1,2-cyclic phosphodiesterase
VKVRIWGARGSIPAPGPETMRYGGNTSCVSVELADGSTLVLDAGTGMRNLGQHLPDPGSRGPLHVLLTHLHLDHIQGLLFFAPMFRPESEIVIWGPAAPDLPLVDRIARYISAPLMPVEVRELPCHIEFREAEATEWQIGRARIRADSVAHRGPTLGYRISEGRSTLCYIPDHEPALGADLDQLQDEWISGLALARDADLLIHDAQYTDAEYPDHLGWGHSSLSDALKFARRAGARRLLAFHHDPLHADDVLDQIGVEASRRWLELGGGPGSVALAVESTEIEVGVPAAA